MSKQLIPRLLLIIVCAAVVLIATLHLRPLKTVSGRQDETVPKIETAAGTQLLWESLSHQFVTSASY